MHTRALILPVLAFAASLLTAHAAPLNASLIKTSGDPEIGTGQFYGYRTPGDGPGDDALDKAQALAASAHVPLVVIWSEENCEHCNAFISELNGRAAEVSEFLSTNREVRESLKSLWWKQLMKIEEKDFTVLVDVAKRQIAEGNVDALTNETLFSLFAALPPTWCVKSEADAKRHFHLFMKMLGANVQAEESSAFGYADAIVETRKGVYVFEFKFNKSAKAAIRQIREKGYADAYKADRRPVTLIGINFSSKKRNIDEPLLERL